MSIVIEIIRGAGMFILYVIGAAALFLIVKGIARSGSFVLNIGFMTAVSAGLILSLQNVGVESDYSLRLIGVLLVIFFAITIIGTTHRKLEKQTGN